MPDLQEEAGRDIPQQDSGHCCERQQGQKACNLLRVPGQAA